MINHNQIPEELQAARQWVCFMLLDNPKKGKPDKVPVNPNSLWGGQGKRPGDMGNLPGSDGTDWQDRTL